MKNKFKNLLLSLFALSLVACGTTPDSSSEKENVSQQESQKESESILESVSESEEVVDTNEKAKEQAKRNAKKSYDDAVLETEDETQKEYLLIVYDNIIIQIELADGTLDEVKETVDNLLDTLNLAITEITKVVNTFIEYKNHVMSQLDYVYSSVTSIINKENIAYVKSIYDSTVAKINAVAESANYKKDLDDAVASFKETAITYSKNIINDITAEAIKGAKETLDALLSSVIDKVEDNNVKTKLQAAHEKAMLEFSSICSNTDYMTMIENITLEYRKVFIELATDYIEQTLPDIKAIAIDKVGVAIDQLKETFDNEKLQGVLNSVEQTAITKINELTDVETAKAKAEEFITDATDAGLDALRDYLEEEITSLINKGVEKITDTDIKDEVEEYINDAKDEIDNLSTLDQIKNSLKTLTDNAKAKVAELVQEQVEKLVLDAQDKLDTYVTGLIAKIDDTTIQTSINSIYEDAKDELDAIESIDDIEDAIKNIYDKALKDCEDLFKQYAEGIIKDLKDDALESIDSFYEQASSKIENEDIKEELDTLYATIKDELDDITDFDTAKEAIDNIIEEAEESIQALVLKAFDEIIDAGKAKLQSGLALMLSNLDTTKYNQAKAIYDDCVEEFENIDTDKDVQKQVEDIISGFVEDAATYCIETVVNYATAAFNKECETVNGYIQQMQIQTYIDDMNDLIDTTQTTLQALTDLFTVVDDTAKQLKVFGKSALDTFVAYQAAWADIVIANTIQAGQDYRDDSLESEDYTSLGTIKKIAAKTAINAAYSTFESTVNELPDVGISAACETALNTLKSTIDTILGRNKEE